MFLFNATQRIAEMFQFHTRKNDVYEQIYILNIQKAVKKRRISYSINIQGIPFSKKLAWYTNQN